MGLLGDMPRPFSASLSVMTRSVGRLATTTQELSCPSLQDDNTPQRIFSSTDRHTLSTSIPYQDDARQLCHFFGCCFCSYSKHIVGFVHPVAILVQPAQEDSWPVLGQVLAILALAPRHQRNIAGSD